MEYLIIEDRNNNEQLLVIKEWFKIVNYADCYEECGQKMGHNIAGSSITTNTKELDEKLFEMLKENYEESNHEWLEEICAGGFFCEDTEGFDIDEIISFCKENAKPEDWELTTPKVWAYDYHDGNNWKTIILDEKNDVGNYNYYVVDNNEMLKKLQNEYDNREFVSEGFGTRQTKSESFEFEESQFQTFFALATFQEKE